MVKLSMKRKSISKSLEAAISRTAYNLSRDGIATSYVDRLIVELLGDDATFAYRLLEHLVGQRGVGIVLRRVMQGIIYDPRVEGMRPEGYYHAMCVEMLGTIEAKRISTAHLLYYATLKGESAFAHEMRGYGIVAEDILKAIDELAEVPQGGDGMLPVEGHKCLFIVLNDVQAS